VVGVLDHGQRGIFAYGTARPDSIFEILLAREGSNRS
jgi:hypothetical protein